MTPGSSWVKLLAAKFLLADGATGTNLFSKGLTTGDAPELWNIENTRKIGELHTAFLEAGSQLILTNSFGGSSCRLKLHKAEKKVTEINYAAAEIAKECADKFQETKIIYSGIPNIMSEYALMVFKAGAKIIGGCCGTTPLHIRPMREALEQASISEKYSSKEHFEKLGEPWKETDRTKKRVKRSTLRNKIS